MASPGLEITPVDYVHVAQDGATTPEDQSAATADVGAHVCGLPPHAAPGSPEAKARSIEELQRFVLHYLVMHIAATTDQGLREVFGALHFPLTTAKVPQFGELPITQIGIGITTTRPSDALVIESAELTGMDVFEEVVKVEDIAQLKDSLKTRLLDVARQQASDAIYLALAFYRGRRS